MDDLPSSSSGHPPPKLNRFLVSPAVPFRQEEGSMGCRMVLCYERDPVRLFSGRFLGRAADLDKALPLLSLMKQQDLAVP